MNCYFKSHPFYHPITTDEAKLLINHDQTFLFCSSNESDEISLVYGATYRSCWEVRVLPVTLGRENTLDILFICNNKASTFGEAIDHVKVYLEGFASFNPSPLLNNKSGISVYEAEESDHKREEDYHNLLDQYNHIYSKLNPHVPTDTLAPGTTEYADGTTTISSLQYYSRMEFICSVDINGKRFNLMVSKRDIHIVGGDGGDLSPEELNQICSLCDRY